MRIMMLVNWKIIRTNKHPESIQPPDYYNEGEDYWFFRYFKEKPQVDVVDISSFKWLEKFEKNRLHFYIWQTVKVLPKLNKYDLIISHGMQSGVVLSLYRRLFKTKARHIVFDIGSFNSAAESGIVLKLMQFVSKSIDGLIYHTSGQLNYYKNFFPWLVSKSYFVRFGTDLEFYKQEDKVGAVTEKYIVCIGYIKRDWKTLVGAYRKIKTDVKLRLIGHVEKQYEDIEGVEQIPFIPVDELKRQINGAIAGVLPLESFNYSFGQMTLQQQMALGKCVITADVPSVRDYVEDLHTAVIYKAGNEDDLAEKIKLVIENVQIREQIGKNAKKWLQINCNEQTMGLDIEKVISCVMQ